MTKSVVGEQPYCLFALPNEVGISRYILDQWQQPHLTKNIIDEQSDDLDPKTAQLFDNLLPLLQRHLL